MSPAQRRRDAKIRKGCAQEETTEDKETHGKVGWRRLSLRELLPKVSELSVVNPRPRTLCESLRLRDFAPRSAQHQYGIQRISRPGRNLVSLGRFIAVLESEPQASLAA